MSPTEPVYFVQISDSHIGPTYDFTRHGHNPYHCTKALIAHLNQLPIRPDFVIHTGDVVADPDPDAYRLAAELFAMLNYPVYFVTGNHDLARDIHRYLPMGPKQLLSKNLDVLCYAFDKKGYRFLVLDARGPDEIDPHGLLSDEMLGILKSETQRDGPPLTVFTHYLVHPINSTWMDAYMLIINGEELHKSLLSIRDRVRAVFTGHVHQNIQVMKDNILYVSVASTFSQFTAWPHESTAGVDPEHPPGFNFVHLLPTQTIIHQHVIPRP